MRNNFEASLEHVLRHEGGYVDHPLDPGGATNMGITRRVLARWRGKPVSKADVRNLTRDEAAAIYRANYWDKVSGDYLPSGLDYCVFDFAVNSGPNRSAKVLQRAARVKADGQIGPITRAAIEQHGGPKLILRMFRRRRNWLETLRTWATFGRGWERRVEELTLTALEMTG